MRISNGLIVVTVIGLVIGLVPTLPFDGPNSPQAPSPNVSPDALGSALRNLKTDDLKGGEKVSPAISLQYAAENGNELALWQLGQMYAKGQGVPRDDYRAFEFFRKFADSNANAYPASQRARYVADAFVTLGHYYLNGISGSSVTANPDLAQRMFTHAASYFGDPEAQYQLARLLLDRKDTGQDPRRAVQWLLLAANKRHYEAQAVLGRILFQGEIGRRQPASGLMWLIIAYDGPGANVPWIAELHESAFKQASDKERAQALVMLERWVEGRRE
jgi:TPR repeat protein